MIREKVKAVRVYIKLIHYMFKNQKNLNDDHKNNHMICKKICTDLLNNSKINCIVYGKNNIPDGDCLIISNHISFFDIIVFLAITDKPVSFAYAENLLKIPILNKYISSLGGVAVTSNKKNIKSIIREIQSSLKKSSLIVFPEGKCSYLNDAVQPFQRGCFVNLKGLNTQILPVYLKYDKIYKFNKWLTPEKNIQVIFNKPFFPDENMTSKTLTKYCYDVVVNSGRQINN